MRPCSSNRELPLFPSLSLYPPPHFPTTQPDRLLHIWIDAFVAKVAAQRPQFVALHLQEVGGKTYDKSMEFVQQFIRILCEAPDMQRFTRIRVYLDEDYSSAEHFTVSRHDAAQRPCKQNGELLFTVLCTERQHVRVL